MTVAVATSGTFEVISAPNGEDQFVLGPEPGEREGVASCYSIAAAPGFSFDYALTPEGWLVTDRVTGIYGCADAPSDALNDFVTAAREHLDVLERQDALTDALSAQREYLRSRLS